MTAAQDERSRPAGNGPATDSLNDNTASVTRPSHADRPSHAGRLVHHWLAAALEVAPDRLALVAVVQTSAGTYRRRVFLSLDAAQKALERAEARGLDAQVVLCELRPVVAP